MKLQEVSIQRAAQCQAGRRRGNNDFQSTLPVYAFSSRLCSHTRGSPAASTASPSNAPTPAYCMLDQHRARQVNANVRGVSGYSGILKGLARSLSRRRSTITAQAVRNMNSQNTGAV